MIGPLSFLSIFKFIHLYTCLQITICFPAGGVLEGECTHMLVVGHEDGLVTVWVVPQSPAATGASEYGGR